MLRWRCLLLCWLQRHLACSNFHRAHGPPSLPKFGNPSADCRKVTDCPPNDPTGHETLHVSFTSAKMAAENTSRDLVHLKRLQTFNDAVFSIVATILILPIRNLESSSGHLVDILDGLWPQIAVYFVAFLVIGALWESHVLRFKILSHVDDILVWLNLTSLMFTSFLPFFCALEGKYYEKYTPIILICIDLLLVEFLEIAIILYSFRNENLLAEELQDLPQDQRKERRDYLLVKKLINPLVYVLAAGLSLVNLTSSWVLLGILIVMPCINRFIASFYRRAMSIPVQRSEFDHMFGNYIDTERVECFSDGVFAIVLTLLVLDITNDEFPTEEKVKKLGIEKALVQMWPKFLSYLGTFVMVALLWFVHHSLFHRIKAMNQFMLVSNNISLACIGLTPLIVAILNRFAGEDYDLNTADEKLAVRASSVVVFLASVAQALVFVLAQCMGPSHLDHRATSRISSRNHNYLAAKLTIIPVLNCVVYYTSFSKTMVSYIVFHTVVLVAPFFFISLKICFGRVGYTSLSHDIVIDPDIETWVPPPPQSRSRIPRGRGSTPAQSIAI